MASMSMLGEQSFIVVARPFIFSIMVAVAQLPYLALALILQAECRMLCDKVVACVSADNPKAAHAFARTEVNKIGSQWSAFLICHVLVEASILGSLWVSMYLGMITETLST